MPFFSAFWGFTYPHLKEYFEGIYNKLNITSSQQLSLIDGTIYVNSKPLIQPTSTKKIILSNSTENWILLNESVLNGLQLKICEL